MSKKKKCIKKNEFHSISCPYCGRQAVVKSASELFDNPLNRNLVFYVCPNDACDARVGVHKGTLKPKGSLANKELREMRNKTHEVFDQLWKKNIMQRSDAYRWITSKLGLKEKAHIGSLSYFQCSRVIQICSKTLSDLNTTGKNKRPIDVRKELYKLG